MIRVFPRKTNMTPVDGDGGSVFFSGPPMWDLPNSLPVCVSVLFTYDRKRGENLAKQWELQGYDVKLGGPAFDDPGGEFVPGRFVKKGCVMTSRGCNNKCWFCSAWKREGDIRELPITEGFNILDSNLLQCSEDHIRKVFEMLNGQRQRALFTGGLEAAKLEDWHIDLMVGLRRKPKSYYFAYDEPKDYEPLVRAAKMVTDAGINRSHNAACYVLIGYPKDTFDDAERRLKQVLRLNLKPFAMLWRDEKGITDPRWQSFQAFWANPIKIFKKYPQGKC